MKLLRFEPSTDLAKHFHGTTQLKFPLGSGNITYQDGLEILPPGSVAVVKAGTSYNGHIPDGADMLLLDLTPRG